MSLDHQLSERVYRSLKTDVLSGILGCGRLNLASLEARYSSSATPVREGLLRLVGEKLVDLRPQGGFGVHKLGPAELIDLYELNLRLLGLITSRRAKGIIEPTRDERRFSSLTPPIDTFFLALAGRAQSRALEAAIDGLNDRLHFIRITENHILTNVPEEYEALKCAAIGPDSHLLLGSLRAYHRRRTRAAKLICTG